MLIDIEFNIDEIAGLDPKKDAYFDEKQFLHDLRLIDVRVINTTVLDIICLQLVACRHTLVMNHLEYQFGGHLENSSCVRDLLNNILYQRRDIGMIQEVQVCWEILLAKQKIG